MRRPLFASVFDTARTQTEDLAAAKTILMLHALAEAPCELATIHAINNRVLLEDCASSPDFIGLVRDRRVRFRILHDGTGPRRELIKRLDFEPYLAAWQEMYEGGKCPGKLIPDYARKAQEYLADETHGSAHANTGAPALDQRLYHAREFFKAIEDAGSNKERQRREEFEKKVVAVPASLARGKRQPLLVGFLKAIVAGDNSSRTAIYTRIDAHAVPSTLSSRDTDDLKAEAKDAIDDAYDSAVAYSLESRLLNCRRRVVATGPELMQSAVPSRAEVQARVLSPEQLSEFASFRLDWIHVKTTLHPKGKADGELEDAFARLVPLLAAFDLGSSGIKRNLEVGGVAAGLSANLLGLVHLAPALHAQGVAISLFGALIAHQTLLAVVGDSFAALALSSESKAIQDRANAFATSIRAPHLKKKLIHMRGWLDLD